MHDTTRRLLLLLILASLGTSGAAAQVLPAIGTRVRVSDNDGQVVVGTIQASTADDVTILAEKSGGSVLIPLVEVKTFERTAGERRRFVKYTTIGTLTVGAIFGTAAALMTMNESSGLLDSPAENFVIGGMVGSLVGIPVGVIAGLSAREELWSTVMLPESGRVTVRIRPGVNERGRIAISVRPR